MATSDPSRPTTGITWDESRRAWKWVLVVPMELARSMPHGPIIEGWESTQFDARERLEEAHRPYRGSREVLLPEWIAASRRRRSA